MPKPSAPGEPSSPARRLLGGRGGSAAMELAILAPLFGALLIGIVDFSIAFYSKLQLTTAVTAGVQYAYLNGQNLSASQVTTLLTNVATVVKGASSFTLGTPTVMFNNVTTNANSANCYCISVSPQTWTVTSCGSACSTNGPTAGKFVTITETYAYTPVFPSQFLSTGTLSDTALVRVQ